MHTQHLMHFRWPHRADSVENVFMIAAVSEPCRIRAASGTLVTTEFRSLTGPVVAV